MGDRDKDKQQPRTRTTTPPVYTPVHLLHGHLACLPEAHTKGRCEGPAPQPALLPAATDQGDHADTGAAADVNRTHTLRAVHLEEEGGRGGVRVCGFVCVWGCVSSSI